MEKEPKDTLCTPTRQQTIHIICSLWCAPRRTRGRAWGQSPAGRARVAMAAGGWASHRDQSIGPWAQSKLTPTHSRSELSLSTRPQPRPRLEQVPAAGGETTQGNRVYTPANVSETEGRVQDPSTGRGSDLAVRLQAGRGGTLARTGCLPGKRRLGALSAGCSLTAVGPSRQQPSILQAQPRPWQVEVAGGGGRPSPECRPGSDPSSAPGLGRHRLACERWPGCRAWRVPAPSQATEALTAPVDVTCTGGCHRAQRGRLGGGRGHVSLVQAERPEGRECLGGGGGAALGLPAPGCAGRCAFPSPAPRPPHHRLSSAQ